jgi:hypothetical protein
MARIRKEVDAEHGVGQAAAPVGPGDGDYTPRIFKPGRTEVPAQSAKGANAKGPEVKSAAAELMDSVDLETKTATPKGSRCFVNGKPVKSMHLQVRGAPAFLVSEDMGTVECTRLYYSPSNFTKEPVFKTGSSDDRLGQGVIESASYETATGLTITLAKGLTMFIHTQWLAGNWVSE